MVTSREEFVRFITSSHSDTAWEKLNNRGMYVHQTHTHLLRAEDGDLKQALLPLLPAEVATWTPYKQQRHDMVMSYVCVTWAIMEYHEDKLINCCVQHKWFSWSQRQAMHQNEWVGVKVKVYKHNYSCVKMRHVTRCCLKLTWQWSCLWLHYPTVQSKISTDIVTKHSYSNDPFPVLPSNGTRMSSSFEGRAIMISVL